MERSSAASEILKNCLQFKTTYNLLEVYRQGFNEVFFAKFEQFLTKQFDTYHFISQDAIQSVLIQQC